jgi:hypothetical protein
MGVELLPARQLNPQVSKTVSRAVSAALQIEVAKRPQSVREFLDALHGKVPLREAASTAPKVLLDAVDSAKQSRDVPLDTNLSDEERERVRKNLQGYGVQFAPEHEQVATAHNKPPGSAPRTPQELAAAMRVAPVAQAPLLRHSQSSSPAPIQISQRLPSLGLRATTFRVLALMIVVAMIYPVLLSFLNNLWSANTTPISQSKENARDFYTLVQESEQGRNQDREDVKTTVTGPYRAKASSLDLANRFPIVWDAAISPDMRTVAATNGERIGVWNVKQERIFLLLLMQMKLRSHSHYSSTGQHLWVNELGILTLRDAKTGKTKAVVEKRRVAKVRRSQFLLMTTRLLMEVHLRALKKVRVRHT